MRPVTLFTGQWADLPFEKICEMASSWGYDGLEIACWGDHMNLEKAAEDKTYCEEKKAILEKYHLKVWALGTHIIGQCVGDRYDERLDGFAPTSLAGKPEAIREWGIKQMTLAPKAARNMGCQIVTGFTGSPLCFYDNYLPIDPVFTDFLHILKNENCDLSIFVFQNATQWHVFSLFDAFFAPKNHSPFHMFAVAHHFFALTNLSCMPGSFRCEALKFLRPVFVSWRW